MYKKICITNRHLVNGDYIEKIEQILKKDIDYIILREKDLSESEYYTLAQQVIALAGNKCILHNFVSVAEKLGHNKIHLSMEEFMKLSVGDILKLDNTIDQDLIVKINGVKKFFARPGLLKDNVCVKITDVYDEMYDLMRNYE